MQLHYESDAQAKAAAQHLIDRFCQVNGGTPTPISAQITGHQLGGACMGMVCDDYGRIKGHPSLYVVDGALIPGSSTCVNPALTIAAIAERCLENILATDLSPTEGGASSAVHK
jgi:cholesterol oxidase